MQTIKNLYLNVSCFHLFIFYFIHYLFEMAMGWGQLEAGLRPSASAAGQGPVTVEKTKTNQEWWAGHSTKDKVQSSISLKT